jgi:phosphatidyl-myo-inositol dimannoside synthase
LDKRILIITRNFPPLVGGMERLMWHVVKQLESNYICDVVGPQGCEKKISGYYMGCRLNPVPLFLASSLVKSVYAAFQHQYHFCIAGSGVTAPIARLVGKRFKIPIITFVHGLDLVVKNRLYQQLFLPAIGRSDIVIVNSHHTGQLAQAKGIAPDKIERLFPGVELPELSFIKKGLREQYQLENKRILLSVGRLIPRKGIVEFLKFSLPNIIKACPDVVFVIIGSEAQNALKKKQDILREIKAVIEEYDLDNRVLLLGQVDEATLESAYQEADLFVFPLREIEGDIEGFGMVAVEAAAYGLPTVAYAVGGVTDAIGHNQSGFLVTPNNYNELTQVIINYLKGDNLQITPETCQTHAKQFSWDNFGKKLRNICLQTEKFKPQS